MSSALRPLLVPGIALATAGVVALGPALVAPPALSVAPPAPLPAVHIEDIQLAGIGQDIYYAITPTVQYAVGGVSYLVNFIPLLGGPSAAQININYFQGIQPIVESTVNYLAAVVADPFNFFPTTGIYASQLYGIGYNWVSAELQFFGFAPLPPLPPASSSQAPAGARTAVLAKPAAAQRETAGVAEAPDAEVTPVTKVTSVTETPAAEASKPPATADVSTPAATSPRERVRAARSVAPKVREQPRAAATAETATADKPESAGKRSAVRAVRAGA